ncbi:MAG: phospho-N-acetylmuramoyl-pentapeptide-transferase [Bacillota bacterium]
MPLTYAPAIASLVLALLLGGPVINAATRLKYGQQVRTDGPKTHLKKQGTPTMGGIIFLTAATLATLVLGIRNLYLWAAIILTLGNGLVGLADDYLKVVKKRSLGLRARDKLVLQALLGLLLAGSAVHLLGLPTSLRIPWFGWTMELGPWYYLFVVLALMGTTNGTNFTDGADGLLGGAGGISLLVYGLVAARLGRLELAIFAVALAAGCLGFLRFNLHPARVFMGDVGSMAIGGALTALAVLTKTELLIPVIGMVYLIEAISVILQVVSFQLTGKRIFRMAPLHHHFEVLGWSENKVVLLFWALSLGFGVISLTAVGG